MTHNFLAPFFSLGFLTVLSTGQADISPAVARISLIQGDVSTQRGDTGGWTAAAVNQPLVGGDSISTGDHSKVELQLDRANILRLGNNSQARIATLERLQNQRAEIQVQIGQGLAYYSISKDSDDEVEIDTPNASIRPTSKDGAYRIEVTGFATQIIVRAGAVEMSTPQGTARVETGQGATVRGTSREAGNVLGRATAIDNWDSWNIDRDGVMRNAESWNYTNRYYVGSEDLDAYGHWVNVPDYGRVWSPKVRPGWSPYRNGRWIWETYWGWTWVSHEPWGWAPYHYGRWFLYGKSWVWWPGPVHAGGDYRPEWAPAYVSFIGFGAHQGVSGRFGSVGWLPLGPGDSFYPWYGGTESQLKVAGVTEAINSTPLNVVAPLRDDKEFSNLRLASVDERIRKAISTLTADRFGTGRFAPETAGRRTFFDGRVITGRLPIVPTREMLSATNRPAKASPMLSGVQQDRYFSKRQPTAPEPFDKEVAEVQQILAENGPLVPVREVTHMDSTDTARPLALRTGIERAAETTKDARNDQRSRYQPETSSRVASSSKMSESSRRMTTPEHRAAETRMARRPSGSSDSATSLRGPAATSTRRTTRAAESGGAVVAHAAQGYINSANRQMDQGNYKAAIANYERALRVDGNSAIAKTRLGRAHRAMQAENEIISSRR